MKKTAIILSLSLLTLSGLVWPQDNTVNLPEPDEFGHVYVSPDVLTDIIVGDIELPFEYKTKFFYLESDRAITKSGSGERVLPTIQDLANEGVLEETVLGEIEAEVRAMDIYVRTNIRDLHRFGFDNMARIVSAAYQIDEVDAIRFLNYLERAEVEYQALLDSIRKDHCDQFNYDVYTFGEDIATNSIIEAQVDYILNANSFFSNLLAELDLSLGPALSGEVRNKIAPSSNTVSGSFQVNLSKRLELTGVDPFDHFSSQCEM